MLYNPFSSYPQKIDELLFFQDIAISQTGIMAHYETLIQKQKYEEANTYINQQTDLHGYFAGLFNLLENRIASLQSYLITKLKNNPLVLSESEPADAIVGTHWIV